MDFMAKINQLKAEKAQLVESTKAALEKNDMSGLEDANRQLEKLNGDIENLEKMAQNSMSAAEQLQEAEKEEKADTKKPKRLFNSLSEQLQAVANAKKTGVVDKRLLEINNDVKGANEGTPADGGYAVQEDFAGAILETAVTTGQVLSRVDSYTVSANSNAARWLQIDETDVTSTVFGGVQMYWAAEGATVAASKPKFKELKLDLEKMMGFAYATDELLQDAAFMSGFFGRAFSTAADRLLESAIISDGDGSGKPLSILSSGATVEVSKTAGQADGSFTAQNALAMWQRVLPKYRSNAVWLIHPDLEDQLPGMYLPIGSESKAVWMPEGGISGAQHQTILGRPVIYSDLCAEMGKKGDVMLADLSQYLLLKKGTARQDWSMHVEFLTDQMCFRMVFRCNGAPKLSAPVKLKNSKNTRSAFAVMGARTTAG